MPERNMSLAARLYTGQVSYDFIRHRRFWFTFSAVLLALCIALLPLRGLTLGIEFSGGTDFQAPMQIQEGTLEQVRAAVRQSSVSELDAQVFALGEDHVRVQTRSLNPDETATVRAELAGIAATEANEVTYNAIGASWGQRITVQASIALVVFMALVMVLIAVYFRDWKMSVAAIVAVLHDLVVTVGVYAAVGFTVTPSTVIGVLTILGYSLYDTVVVFDKVRENVRGLADSKYTYSYLANKATNQVIVRSLNTTVIGILPVLALFVAGTWLQSGPLSDLGLSLLVGMIAGAYSSLFIATPLLAWLREREPAMVEHRERLKRREDRAEAKATQRREHEESLEPVKAARGPRRTSGSRAERKGKR